ncbi:MAG: FtsX-like permease family protein, partial [Acidobacteriota bacterium]
VSKLIADQGHSVRRVDVPEPGKHPHSQIMGLLLLSMSSFGLFVLLLSGILVVNLMMALMAGQVRQIGIMKALGGSRRQIAAIYLAQALLLGLVAIALALPAGIWGSRLLCRYMAVFLNFDIDSFFVPAWVYLLVGAVGVGVPVLAALYPVWKGSGVSVRDALTDFGLRQSAFGSTAFDRALATTSGMARPVMMAIRNSFRRRLRLILTVATLSVGGLFFMSALNLRASLINTLDRLFATRQFDLSVNLGTMQSYEGVERAIRATPGILRSEGWIVTEGLLPDLPGQTPTSSQGAGHHLDLGHGSAGEGRRRFGVVALPGNSTMLHPNIIEGRALQAADADALMVVNSSLAAMSRGQMRVGGNVSARVGPSEQDWRVVGIAAEPFSPPVAYIPISYIERQGGHGGLVNSVRLALERVDSESIDTVKADLDRNLGKEGLGAQSSSSTADSRFGFDQHMLMIYVFLVVMSCIIAGVGGLGLVTTMSLNVLERRREMGILRAIGASPRMVWLIVVVEGVVVGLLSWVLAAVLAWPISNAVGSHLVTAMFKSRMNLYFDPRGVLIWLLVSVTLGAVASIVPAWNASRRPVREAIGYE